MSSPVADPQVAKAFMDLDAAVAQVQALAWEPADIADAYAYARTLEAVGRRVGSLKVGVLNQIEATGVHKTDGHASAKVMVRYACNLSTTEAKRRAKAARMLRAMPLVAAAFDAGLIGECQVLRIARVHANPRVQDEFELQDANVAVLAARLPYEELDEKLTNWERLADEDGAGDRAERAHHNRDHAFLPNFDGSWAVDGGHGGLQGAEMNAIHVHFIKKEFDADWAEARARLGDAATREDLRRTDKQRRADAAHAAWKAAAAAQADLPGGSLINLSIVMDQQTFERELRRMCGDDPGPDERADTLLGDAVDDLLAQDAPLADVPDDDPIANRPNRADPDLSGRLGAEGPNGPEDQAAHPHAGQTDAGHARTTEMAEPTRTPFTCRTGDGHPLHPSEAVVAALLGHVRRVVIGSEGIVLNQGRLQRLFRGGQRDAVMIPHTHCTWVGCLVPVSDCQADHLEAFNGPRQGSTDPGNGAPACGRHNRLKERGFDLYRDERGRLHIVRPDGTEIL